MPASITLTVAHLPTSTSFFLSCLQPLNYVYRGRVNDTIGFGHPDAAPDFWITQSVPGVPPGPAHVAFPALSRAKVHEFFYAALKAGGKVHGEPALRDDCGYYSAAIVDVDGNSIEAVFRPDLLEANKENIDDAKSVASVTKSVATSKASSAASSASRTKSIAPSKVASVAPSTAAKSSVSKAPSAAPSAAPSKALSMAPSQAARTVVISGPPQSSASRAPTAAVSPPSEAPARTTLSRAPTAPAAPQGAGNNFADMINEARGTVAFARQMIDQTRALTSPPLTSGAATNAADKSTPNSHGPSDTIVGTLLGVAAGAALHYAFSSRNETAPPPAAPTAPPNNYAVARSESAAPSWTQERYYYYHQQPQQALPASSQVSRPYAIEEAPLSEISSLRSLRPNQRLIEMVDNEPTLSEVAPSATIIRPRGRRSSFSAVSANTGASRPSRASVKMLEGPPVSYRAPTAITMNSDGRPRSRRASSVSSRTTTMRAADEGYASATEDRKSRVSISISRTGSAKHSHHSRSHAPSQASSHTTRVRTSSPPPAPGSTTSGTTVTAIKTPSQHPLPPSRAASHVPHYTSSTTGDSFHSTHSKRHKTVIGRLTEKQLSKLEEGGRLAKGNTDVTRSVIGKVKAVDALDVSGREIRPEDSVSQVSSTRGSRRSGR